MTILAKSNICLISHCGKEIYHVDFSNRRNMYDLIDAIEQASIYSKIHIKEYGKKDILMLMDLSNSYVFGKAVDMLNRTTDELKKFTKKRAIVGLDKSKMILLNISNLILGKRVKAFKSISKAKEWLVE